jgi:hypothetical protein
MKSREEATRSTTKDEAERMRPAPTLHADMEVVRIKSEMKRGVPIEEILFGDDEE